MKKNLAVPGVVAVVALIIGFGAGYYVPHGGTPSRGSFSGGQFAGRTGTGTATFARGGAGGGGFTAGTILSAGNGSITISEQNGSSTEIVLLSPQTQVEKTVSGSQSDLTPGTDVVVTGSSNSDGSLSAQSIQVRPAGSNAPMIRAGAPGQ